MTDVSRPIASLVLGILAASMLIAAGSCASPPRSLQRADVEREVAALLQEWAAAISEGRLDDFKALYAERPGMVWVERGAVQYRSAAALAESVDQVMSGGTQIENVIDEVAVEPLAPGVAGFSFSLTSTVRNPQYSFTFDGVMTGVAIEEAGSWKLYRGHLSEPPAQ